MPDMMRAMAAAPGGVTVVEVPKPAPGPGEVLVRVMATAVNPGEEKVMSGDFVGRFLHARVSPLILGWDFAGRVEAVGGGLDEAFVGTAVWGHLAYSNTQKQGAWAEYITVPAQSLAAKPADVPHHVAAAAATVTMTSLQSLRDLGGLGDGGKALIIGAAGGIGAVAVGIAKRLGGHVTGVCSTKDVARVEALGADEVIDRKQADALAARDAYDVVFDTPAVHSFAGCAPTLRQGGAYVTTLPDLGLVTGMARALLSSKRCYFVQVASKRADLELVGRWLQDGLAVPIDSRHKIADLGLALERQLDGGRSGRVVVDLEGGWPE